MGIKLGKLLRNVGTLGTTWIRDQKRAGKKRKRANQLQADAMRDAEEFRNRDLGQTAFNGVQADPALQAAQQRSLARTEQIANEGYTDVDRQAMQQQLNDVARYEQSQRASLASDARARGVSGSGMDIMAQQLAQQSGADRAMQTGTDMAIAGRDRSMQANAALGDQAGAMRDQGFGEQATIAGAQDQYAQWRAGTQANDFQQLQAARGIQAGNLNQQANGLEATENLDAAANAVANYYTAGQAANGPEGGASNSVGAPGGGSAKSMTGGAAIPTTPVGGAQYPASAPQQKAMPGMGAPAPTPKGMPPTQPNPAMPPNPGRPNGVRAARGLMSRIRGAGTAQSNAAAQRVIGNYAAGSAPANPYRRPRG